MSASHPTFDAAAFCALPLVRRTYKALVMGLAVFIVTLVLLREPFRGYLAEVQIAGPGTAALDLDDAARWIKQVDRHAVVVTIPAGEVSPRSWIRMTYLDSRPTSATTRLNELADRWLYQYLPERLQAHRRAILAEVRTAATTAREREDALRQRVEGLRQQQLAAILQPTVPEQHTALQSGESQPREAEAPGEPAISADSRLGRSLTRPYPDSRLGGSQTLPSNTDQHQLRERLEALKSELSRLLASFTEEHPQVVALRAQIAGLERQLGSSSGHSREPPSTPALLPAPAADPQAAATGPSARAAKGHFVSTTLAVALQDQPEANAPANVAADLNVALAELSRASRERQQAEHRLSDRMQELSSQPTAADWSVQPAHVVTRLGGTPRCATLALGGLLAGIGVIVMFRASAEAVLPPRIQTAFELASVLEIPVVGNASLLRTAAARIRRRLFTPTRVRLVTHMAEAIVVVAVAACLLSMAIEPPLAWQVLADPFGTLSEVIGRLMGN